MNLTSAASRGGGFDAAQYKHAFRAACARRGVDPVYGASVYQAINARADQLKADKRRAIRAARDPMDGAWWQQPELWFDLPPNRSNVERIVFEHLFHVALIIALYRFRTEAARAYA
ncbi:MAG: hypothetical protein SGI73_18400 [Chloroflexota bacterium]|nr:hypothetical protein [Chloroflexota bacterium]